MLPNGYYTIENVKYKEKLFAGVMKFNRDRRYALTYPGLYSSDPAVQWDVRSLGGGVVTIKHAKHQEYLYVGWNQKFPFRRWALTWIPSGWDATKDKSGQWRLRQVRTCASAEAVGT